MVRSRPSEPTTPAVRTPTRIQSVERASTLLMLVADGSTDGTGKALAEAAGLAVPTAHHLLGTLVAARLLTRDAAGRYILGPAVAVLADSFHRTRAVSSHLSRALHGLAETTSETTYLAGWRNRSIEMLEWAEGTLPVRVSLPAAATYDDAHARAGGKALLAFAPDDLREEYLDAHPLRPATPATIVDRHRFDAELARIRERGVAYDEEEFIPGVACAAVAVRSEGELFAYSMSLPAHRFAERRHELTEALLAAARSAGDVLGAHHRGDGGGGRHRAGGLRPRRGRARR